MQLKGRVTRFSEFTGSGLAITKIGTVSFSCVVRTDSGHDPIEGDALYLEIPNPDEGELEAIVEAVAWARSQEALEIAVASWKPRNPRKIKDNSFSVMHPYEEDTLSAVEGMNEEARYFWYLQTIARAVALQELDSISMDELKEMMAHIAAFKATYPERAERIGKRVETLIANL